MNNIQFLAPVPFIDVNHWLWYGDPRGYMGNNYLALALGYIGMAALRRKTMIARGAMRFIPMIIAAIIIYLLFYWNKNTLCHFDTCPQIKLTHVVH